MAVTDAATDEGESHDFKTVERPLLDGTVFASTTVDVSDFSPPRTLYVLDLARQYEKRVEDFVADDDVEVLKREQIDDGMHSHWNCELVEMSATIDTSSVDGERTDEIVCYAVAAEEEFIGEFEDVLAHVKA